MKLITRLAPVTADSETKSVRATISTGADVDRGDYIERLDLSAIKPDDLIGLPVLDSHQQYGLDHLIGVVDAAGIDTKGIWADIRLSERAEHLWPDIESGIVRSLSIGFTVQAWKESNEKGRRIRTAVKWKILEISLVATPADPGATIRSHPMEDEIIIDADRIRSIGEIADLPPSFAEDQITRGASVEEARVAARAAMVERATRPIRVVSENPAGTVEHRAEALHVRVAGGTPSEQARPFMQDRLIDHARAACEAAGISTRGLSTDEVFTRAHTTSDFPALLQGVGARSLMPAYQAAQSPLKALARQVNANDFRPMSRLKLSDTGPLQKLSESGEIKHTTRAEAVESYALDSYASIFALSRKALVNDDLGAFRDWAAVAGRAAAQTEADVLWNLLKSNPKMGEDGKALFHADHGNLPTASALDVDAVSAARLALRTQKGLDGKTALGLTPKFLLVGPQLETAADQIIAAIYAASTADVNPYTAKLVPLVEPRITDKSWYVFADTAAATILEYAYLSSAPGPQLASREGWDVLGQEFRVVLDFGAGAVDWRGAVKNAGQ